MALKVSSGFYSIEAALHLPGFYVLLTPSTAWSIDPPHLLPSTRKINRASIDTQLDFNNAGPADPIPTDNLSFSRHTASQSTNGTNPAVPAKDVTDVLKRKRKRSSRDDSRHDNRNRFHEPVTSRFPQNGISAKADKASCLRGDDSVVWKACQGEGALKGPQNVSTSTRPPVQPFLLPLTVKDASPWKSYNKEYTVELGGLVIVAERKHPAHGLVVVKEFSGHDAGSKLSRLRQIPEEIRNSYFLSHCEIFNFQNALHVITEYMTIFLFQIVAAPRYPREKQVAAIIGQIG